jgi:DNA polymerase-3 subunit delta'
VEAVARLLEERDGVAPQAAREAAMAAQCHIGMARRLARDPEARARREKVLELPLGAASVGQAVLAAGELVEVAQAEAKAQLEERDAVDRAALHRALGVQEGDRSMPPAARAAVRQFDEDSKRRATRLQRDVLDRAMLDLLSFYRDVLAVQNRAGVELINGGHAGAVERVAQTSGEAATLRRIEALDQARQRLAGNVQPALALEAMAVGLVLAGE